MDQQFQAGAHKEGKGIRVGIMGNDKEDALIQGMCRL